MHTHTERERERVCVYREIQEAERCTYVQDGMKAESAISGRRLWIGLDDAGMRFLDTDPDEMCNLLEVLQPFHHHSTIQPFNLQPCHRLID